MIFRRILVVLPVLLCTLAIPPRSAAQPAKEPGERQDAAEQDEPAESPNENVSVPDNSDPSSSLPKLEDLETPSVEELLNGPQIDWIVLKKEMRVIIVQPVRPRPNTLEKMQEALDGDRRGADESSDEYRKRHEQMSKVNVIFAGGQDVNEYELHMNKIDHIKYHENLVMDRVRMLIDAGKIQIAYELFALLMRKTPDWPGTADVQDYFLFAQAGSLIKKNQPESALVYLEDLHAHNPNFSGLINRLGEVIDGLIADATAATKFRRARHFLDRLATRTPNHDVVKRWRAELLARAEALVDTARKATAAGEHDKAYETIEQASRIWPNTPGLRAAHQQASRRFQQLRVGVLQFPSESPRPGSPTVADVRHRHLTKPRLFEVTSSQEKTRYHSGFFERWEPTDLGRRAVFSLRQVRAYWESQPVVTSGSIIATLATRLDPSSPGYDERFASYISSVKSRSPFEFEIEFERVPLQLEALFNLSPSDVNSSDTTSVGTSMVPRFRLHHRDEIRNVYRRAFPEPDDSPEFHVTEIVEVMYASYRKAMQGLMRGEVSLLPRVQSWDVPLLMKSDQFFVQQYAMPVTHVLQINPHSEPLSNRELRRSLAYALDRRSVLTQTVLKDPEGARGRLVTAPFSKESYAYNTLVRPRQQRLYLSRWLSLAAQKQLGGSIPKLKLLCAADPVAQAAAGELVRQWAIVGLEVELEIEGTAGDGQSQQHWDLYYRTIRMAEPVVELWPFLTAEPTARVEALKHLPDLLRQELIELDASGDWSAAIDVLRRLHRHLWAEVHFIPLWEVDDYLVIRRNVEDFRTEPFRTYDDVERWTINSWYSTEAP